MPAKPSMNIVRTVTGCRLCMKSSTASETAIGRGLLWEELPDCYIMYASLMTLENILYSTRCWRHRSRVQPSAAQTGTASTPQLVRACY
jgi:hypothetical protein